MMAQDTTHLMQDNLRFSESLYEIACSSDDAETVRIAMAALTSTDTGMAFLSANPIKL